MTVKTVHRSLLITAVAGGLMLASQPLASAAIQPATIPTPTSITKTAPAVPVPVPGGTADLRCGHRRRRCPPASSPSPASPASPKNL